MSGCHTLVRTTAAGAPGIACVSRIAPPVGVTMVMEASLQRAASTSRGQNPCCSRRPAAHQRFDSQPVLLLCPWSGVTIVNRRLAPARRQHRLRAEPLLQPQACGKRGHSVETTWCAVSEG